MAPQLITLVRHGEAQHNVTQDDSIPDTLLTPLGESQCRSLRTRFPPVPPVDVIFTSPLRRTLQTTMLGFEQQINAGVPVIALAELQETSTMPCDTGHSVSVLKEMFPSKIDFSRVPSDWASKTGRWSAEADTVEQRATWVRKFLAAREEAHIVCVLHGGFLHYVTEDWTGRGRFPGTGWANTEFRSYVFGSEGELVETEQSLGRREERPLGRSETKQFEQTKLPN